MRPTPEFRAHHDVEDPRVDELAFRQAWRVHARLDQLLAAKRINRDVWQAANDFRATWAIAREISGREPGMIRIGSADSGDASMIARLDAETKIAAVEQAIGRLATALVVACVIADLPWAAVARHCRRHPHTVRDWTVLALFALARAWEAATRRPRTLDVPRQPETRPRRVAAS
jgi:hypothetical protein